MIGDAEHVEAVATVEVDELPKSKLPIAPRRMGVELAKQRSLHDLSVWLGHPRMGNGVVNVVGKGGSPPAWVGGLPGRADRSSGLLAPAVGTADGAGLLYGKAATPSRGVTVAG